MFRAKTVFVVGAGASVELNFPSGAKLLDQIAHALNILFEDGYSMTAGDRRIYEAYQQLARQPDGRLGPVNPYQYAGWRVRDAAHLGLSIDNVINQFDDDPLVAQVGKIAIARLILQAEQKSTLRIPTDRIGGVELLAAVRPTWLGGFAQLLVQDRTRTSLKGLFDNVAVVSFNYDRSIRRFLPIALMSQFGLGEPQAHELAKQLPIYHPYGSLGPLPWEEPSGGVAFGDADRASLIDVAARLRTFTEQVDDGDELDEMREALSSATRIVFLGFGYHRQNIALLTDKVTGHAERVFGTALGLSEADKDVVRTQLGHFIKSAYRGHEEPRLASLGCVDFISEYFRALTA